MKVDFNIEGIVTSKRVDVRSGNEGAPGAGRWIRKAALVPLGLSLTACGFFGGGREDYDGRFYVGAGALISEVEPDTDNVPGVSVDDSNSSGGSLAIGYDFSPRFSLEGHIADLGEAELAPEGSIDYQVGGISAIVYGLASEERRARREGFSVFGRLGVGALENDAEVVEFERLNDVHLLAGIGLEYGFRMGLGVRAELVAHDTDAQYGQLGLVYRFGQASGGGTPVSRSVDPIEPPESDVSTRAVPVPSPSNSRINVDTDGDGVTDAIDQCGDTSAGHPVDSTGCDVFGGVVEGVNFTSSSDTLTPEAQLALDRVAETLGNYPDVVVSVEAHTDNQGAAAGNLELSKQRALSVARYLASKGVSGAQLKPQAFGESRPRTSNATAAGRAQNRRVEINIVE